MPRYILIDNHSGLIWGDTADFLADAQSGLTPLEAAKALDGSLGETDRDYDEVPRRALANNETGYHVYRADVHKGEAIPVVLDGADQETIEAVERDCEYVTTLRVLFPRGGV